MLGVESNHLKILFRFVVLMKCVVAGAGLN